ncbi:MAG: hypothetical protein CMF49_08625 [Legionellales bacterium]|nr:hypothetical protein [Legionellales bacterium]|tara:strand:- start:278 stop:625 length:348 start_codon:yes stop_codon:yes gene_type:complete
MSDIAIKILANFQDEQRNEKILEILEQVLKMPNLQKRGCFGWFDSHGIGKIKNILNQKMTNSKKLACIRKICRESSNDIPIVNKAYINVSQFIELYANLEEEESKKSTKNDFTIN